MVPCGPSGVTSGADCSELPHFIFFIFAPCVVRAGRSSLAECDKNLSCGFRAGQPQSFGATPRISETVGDIRDPSIPARRSGPGQFKFRCQFRCGANVGCSRNPGKNKVGSRAVTASFTAAGRLSIAQSLRLVETFPKLFSDLRNSYPFKSYA
jgi:hypothetical protein